MVSTFYTRIRTMLRSCAMELSISLDEFHSYNWDNWLEEIFLSLSLFFFSMEIGKEGERERWGGRVG